MLNIICFNRIVDGFGNYQYFAYLNHCFIGELGFESGVSKNNRMNLSELINVNFEREALDTDGGYCLGYAVSICCLREEEEIAFYPRSGSEVMMFPKNHPYREDEDKKIKFFIPDSFFTSIDSSYLKLMPHRGSYSILLVLVDEKVLGQIYLRSFSPPASMAELARRIQWNVRDEFLKMDELSTPLKGKKISIATCEESMGINLAAVFLQSVVLQSESKPLLNEFPTKIQPIEIFFSEEVINYYPVPTTMSISQNNVDNCVLI